MQSIAVFIPIYNGESYLRSTLQSILDQTYEHFTVYCVNDSSTDSSLHIINEFSKNDGRIIVFTKEQGGSTAKSWNFVLPKIKEDFIFYMSQDDLLSPDVFEKMIERQAETDSDCILPEMILYHGDEKDNELISGLDGDQSVILTGIQAFQKCLQWQIHGFALRKTELYNDEYFFEDAYDTDDYMSRKLFYKCKKVAFSTGSFFYRQDNPGAITKTFGIKNYYSLSTSLRIYSLILQSDQLKRERKNWFSYMIKTYTRASRNFRINKGITTTHEKKEVKKFLKQTRHRLLRLLFSAGNLWAKAYWLKEIYFSKIYKIKL